ncbi:30S ribosomal protein S9 [Candidatus Falkowbacteria bacterium]|nr:30S ribosomal protein S9 [Candidatus Falkowbacteria bacterium]
MPIKKDEKIEEDKVKPKITRPSSGSLRPGSHSGLRASGPRTAGSSTGPSLRSGKYFYAVGGRKDAKSTVHLYAKGKGDITVNGKDYKEYFPYFEFQKIIEKPMEVVGEVGKVDISARARGGGKRGQAEAIRHGIAMALDKYNVDFHTALKKEGLFTRDRRVKERKKPGLKRARRAPQWQKR